MLISFFTIFYNTSNITGNKGKLSPDDSREVLDMPPTLKLLSEVVNTGDLIVGKGRIPRN